MSESLNPYIESFRARAEAMDTEGVPHDEDAPLALLAQLMSEEEGALSESAVLSLAEIGGHLYREGLRRRMIRRVK